MHETGFIKLFSTIITSTVWQEDAETKVVWITLLALANRYGEIPATEPGIARAAGVSLEKAVEALSKFQQPDPFSRSRAFEGRRIERVDGGYRLLNYDVYREKSRTDERREYLRHKQAERRRRPKIASEGVYDRSTTCQQVSTPSTPCQQMSTLSTTVNQCQPIAEAEAEADIDTDIPPLAPPRGGSAPRKKRFGEFVKLTSDEHTRLMERFGESRTADLIEALNNGIGSKGYKYKSHYHTILSWARKDAQETEPDGSAELHFEGISEEEAIRLYYEMGKIDESERDRQLAELKRQG